MKERKRSSVRTEQKLDRDEIAFCSSLVAVKWSKVLGNCIDFLPITLKNAIWQKLGFQAADVKAANINIVD
jgi:hypothetical protein